LLEKIQMKYKVNIVFEKGDELYSAYVLPAAARFYRLVCRYLTTTITSS
jgi:hypothetical protein